MIAPIRRHLPGLGLILLAGFVLRLLWILSVHPEPNPSGLDDTVWYRGAAHFIARGEGYLNPYVGTPTAGWPPGYPFFLGAVFKASGEGIWQTYAANIVLALLTITVVYGIGLKLFDRRTALVGAAAAAVWPGQIYFTSLTLSEPLFTFLFALGVLLLVLAPDAGAWRGALLVAFGLVTGAAVLTRGQALVLLPVALAVWGLAGYRWKPAIAWTMLAAVVAGVCLAPWVARNQRELGSPVLLATNFGPNLWIGNHAGASGRMAIAEAEPPQPERGNLTQGEFEVAADKLALRRGLRYIVTHPTRELELAGTKVRAMYEADSTGLDWNSGYTRGYYSSQQTEDALRGIANSFWFGALVLAGVGLLASRMRLNGPLAVLPLLVLVWTATHLAFFGEPRFHYPIVFAFALLSARGLVVLFDAVRRPQPVPGGRYAAA